MHCPTSDPTSIPLAVVTKKAQSMTLCVVQSGMKARILFEGLCLGGILPYFCAWTNSDAASIIVRQNLFIFASIISFAHRGIAYMLLLSVADSIPAELELSNILPFHFFPARASSLDATFVVIHAVRLFSRLNYQASFLHTQKMPFSCGSIGSHTFALEPWRTPCVLRIRCWLDPARLSFRTSRAKMLKMINETFQVLKRSFQEDVVFNTAIFASRLRTRFHM